MQSLYSKYGELEGITIECQNELIAIGITNDAATAEVFLQGAQISQYQRKNEKPILWLSEQCDYKQGTSLRGGIPICWPWFGNMDKNPQAIQALFTEDKLKQLGAHGFVRERSWQVFDIRTPSADLTIIDLGFTVYAEQELLWPYATKLHYQIEIGHELKASLSVTNKDSMPFSYSCALHTYFAIDHIDNAKIEGFDQTDYIDCLDNWQSHTQDGDITFNQEVDRIYQSGPDKITLQDKERVINIGNTGSNSTVIWNPWIDKSMRLSQFDDQDYLKMLCIETANIMDDIIYLEPGAEYKLDLTIA